MFGFKTAFGNLPEEPRDILIVDDDKYFRDGLVAALTSLEIGSVVCAASMAEATAIVCPGYEQTENQEEPGLIKQGPRFLVALIDDCFPIKPDGQPSSGTGSRLLGNVVFFRYGQRVCKYLFGISGDQVLQGGYIGRYPGISTHTGEAIGKDPDVILKRIESIVKQS